MLLKRILLPLIMCLGFIGQTQAGMMVVDTVNAANVNSTVPSNAVQDWFKFDINEAFDSFTLTFNWRDQGWGNRKGIIYFRLAGSDWLSAGLLAEHFWTTQSITVTAEQLNTNALASSRVLSPSAVEIGFAVGSGGGHRLLINNAVLTVTNVPEPISLALFILGAIGFATARRRYK